MKSAANCKGHVDDHLKPAMTALKDLWNLFLRETRSSYLLEVNSATFTWSIIVTEETHYSIF
ncbi:unnamed protein product [Arabidopsis thaliana]|uniref:(thale cress) hypothetical protein n=1 Tax=Arabidopsis thaliana TaxID=3702 RepID=A0A7G2EK95_ARATH|nr:unnamed protein product [Arabidopsis thaliana]